MLSLTVLIGRLGRDAETRTTETGRKLARLSLATTRPVKKGDEWEEVTEWHNVVLWGQPAEYAGEFAKKGDLVYVMGEPRAREWQDQDGHARTAHEVVVGGPQHAFKRLAGSSKHQEGDEPPRQNDAVASLESKRDRAKRLAEQVPF